MTIFSCFPVQDPLRLQAALPGAPEHEYCAAAHAREGLRLDPQVVLRMRQLLHLRKVILRNFRAFFYA
jgi:hypothetical protein